MVHDQVDALADEPLISNGTGNSETCTLTVFEENIVFIWIKMVSPVDSYNLTITVEEYVPPPPDPPLIPGYNFWIITPVMVISILGIIFRKKNAVD